MAVTTPQPAYFREPPIRDYGISSRRRNATVCTPCRVQVFGVQAAKKISAARQLKPAGSRRPGCCRKFLSSPADKPARRQSSRLPFGLFRGFSPSAAGIPSNCLILMGNSILWIERGLAQKRNSPATCTERSWKNAYPVMWVSSDILAPAAAVSIHAWHG